MVAAMGATTGASAAPAEGQIRLAGGATAVADSYIVVFKDSAVSTAAVSDRADELARQYKGTVGHVYKHALRGFEIRLPEQAAKRLAANPAVEYVEQNHTVQLLGTQSPTPSWGLDRVDQRNLPLNNSYTYPTTASGVRAYIVDTGILTTHQDFGGRAVHGRDTVNNDNDATDCNGHGTHVAGTVGGSSYGIAKGVTLVAVRVLDCSGSGTNAGVIAGIDWVTADHDPGELAVANMSLGGSYSSTLNDAVANSVADGVTYAVAAGNSNANACNYSPARTAAAITVGATTSSDARASYSNYGTCLDIFAPGSSITSAWMTNDTATNTISGTSMASPHVAGGAALVLSANPGFTAQQVRDRLVADATPNKVTNPGTGTPNVLLFVNTTPGGGNQPPTASFTHN
ncbi:MAG TPA: S8 family peptidase, partial [Micromonosporaceae bacterium]